MAGEAVGGVVQSHQENNKNGGGGGRRIRHQTVLKQLCQDQKKAVPRLGGERTKLEMSESKRSCYLGLGDGRPFNNRGMCSSQ